MRWDRNDIGARMMGGYEEEEENERISHGC